MISAAMKNLFDALSQAAHDREPIALGIITQVKGSSPQKIGAKAIFHQDGRIEGTLGGGCLEAEIQQRALASLHSGKPEKFDLLLDHDFGWDDGLICGGKVSGLILPLPKPNDKDFWNLFAARKTISQWGVAENFSIAKITAENESHFWLYRETVAPRCSLWIAGAGHISQATAPLALQLDFAVTVFDDRPALANHQNFPADVSLKVDAWEKLASLNPPLETPSFALIVTRGHRHDALVLKDWLKKHFSFIGMIGSSRKARTIFEHFISEKIATPEELARVACPVGIEIDSESVSEIAVSIMAQFIEKRAKLIQAKRLSRPAQSDIVRH